MSIQLTMSYWEFLVRTFGMFFIGIVAGFCVARFRALQKKLEADVVRKDE